LKKIYIEIKRGGKMPQKLQTQPTQQIDSQAMREKLLSDDRLFKLVVIYDRLTWGSENSENRKIIAKYANELGIKDLNNVKKEIEKEIRNFLKNDKLNDKQIENLTNLLTDNWQTRKLFISEKYLKYAQYQIENRLDFEDKAFDFNIRQILSLLPEEIKNKKKISNGQRVAEALKDLTIHGLEHILDTSRQVSLYEERILDTNLRNDIGKFNETSRTIQNAIDPQLNFAFKEALKTDETTGGPGTTREPKPRQQGPTPQKTAGPQKTQKPPNPFLKEVFGGEEIVDYAIESGAGKVKESKNVRITREIIYKYFNEEKDEEKKKNMREALILIFDFLGGPKAYEFIAKKAGEGKTAEDVLVEAVRDFRKQYGKSLNKEQKESLDNVLKPKETTKPEGGTSQHQPTGTTQSTTPTQTNNQKKETPTTGPGTDQTQTSTQTQTNIQKLQTEVLQKLIMAVDKKANKNELNTLDLVALKNKAEISVGKFIRDSSLDDNSRKDKILESLRVALNRNQVDKMRELMIELFKLGGAIIEYESDQPPSGFTYLHNYQGKTFGLSANLDNLINSIDDVSPINDNNNPEQKQLSEYNNLLSPLMIENERFSTTIRKVLKEIIEGKEVSIERRVNNRIMMSIGEPLIIFTTTSNSLTDEQKWQNLNIAATVFRIWGGEDSV
jgi:hypothetical protein